ncbi:MAG: cbb3-type cytochrome c oxidase subunit I, partial [Alphaproteobacteria bacterium]|nr:cbb3-type cytochrome c oxidase subunit I [Alphaproteobacteria bacterium]
MATGTHAAHGAHEHHDHTPGFFVRWFLSTNHKDIGTLYMVLAATAGLLGGAISVYMRLELMNPGIQLMGWHENPGHHWNSMVTAHGLIMVFFVVMPALIGGFGNWIVP